MSKYIIRFHNRQEVVVGTADNCDVRVAGAAADGVARYHLIITLEGEKLRIKCLGEFGMKSQGRVFHLGQTDSVGPRAFVMLPGCPEPLPLMEIYEWLNGNASMTTGIRQASVAAPSAHPKTCSGGMVDRHRAVGDSHLHGTAAETQAHANHVPERPSLVGKVLAWLRGRNAVRGTVYASVFAPSAFCLGEMCTIQVLLYGDKDAGDVERRARMVAPNAEEKNNQTLGLKLKRGTRISIELEFFYPEADCEQLRIDRPKQEVTWDGVMHDVTFHTFVPNGYKYATINGRALLSVSGFPLAEMAFVVRRGQSAQATLAAVTLHTMQRVFISYSHLDADKVKLIAEAYRAVDLDYFFDRHTLKPGDRYPEKIYAYIDRADIFFLCWSKNAAQSEWVEKEYRRALANLAQEGRLLRLYPVCYAPYAELPKEIGENFNAAEIE